MWAASRCCAVRPLTCGALCTQDITDKVKDAANQTKGAVKDAAGAVKGKVRTASYPPVILPQQRPSPAGLFHAHADDAPAQAMLSMLA